MNNTSCTKRLLQSLNENSICYCVLKADEQKQYVDLFVHLDDLAQFRKLLSNLAYTQTGSTADTYSFIYCLEADSFWENKQGHRIHAACQMFCSSLSNLSKSKLPLDHAIQQSLWQNKVWNEKEQYWEISREDYFIYLLVDCVFNQHAFDEASIYDISTLAELLDSPTLVEKLKGVFFKYTTTLISLIKESRFSEVFQKYQSFCDY